MALLFTAVVIHGDQFSIYINGLHQSITLAVPETEESLLKRGKTRLKANLIGTPVGELMFTEKC